MTRFARHASVALAAATLAVTVTACNPPADKAKQEAKTEEAGKAFGPQIAGLPTTALLTHMGEPLASAAGNALEVGYALDHLTGRRREPRFHEVTVALGAEMLVLGRLAPDLDAARARIEEAFASGAAAERFARMVTALGGPADLLEKPERHLAAAPIVKPVFAEAAGAVAEIDTRAVGLAVVARYRIGFRAEDGRVIGHVDRRSTSAIARGPS